jgi:protein-tyrosine-phosphatase
MEEGFDPVVRRRIDSLADELVAESAGRFEPQVIREERDDGAHDVVFVGLGGGGRGQIAAALTTLLSANNVEVHSAGTAVHGEIDPAVSAVITELGIDVADAFARPIAPEVLQAADVVVTMGHCIGEFDIPAGVGHEDRRVGDPVGAPIEEVRRVRDDIERRVRELLSRLGVEATPASHTPDNPDQRPDDTQVETHVTGELG